MNPKLPRPQVQVREVNLLLCPVMVKGIKGEFHRQAYQAKRARCPFDAGFDVYPDSTEPLVISLGASAMIKVGTSVHFCFPPGAFGMLVERSSSNEKLDGAIIRPGIFDAGYTGECLIRVLCDLTALDKVMAAIKKAQADQVALAQMLILSAIAPQFMNWDEGQVPPGRGSNGFGHTDNIRIV